MPIKKTLHPLLLLLLCLSSCGLHIKPRQLHEDLSVRQLSRKTILVQSVLSLKSGTRFPCNALLYVHKGEAILFDTPHTAELSEVLRNWLKDELHVELKAVVANHFHFDCTAGLDVFHADGVPSFGSRRTVYEAGKHGEIAPQFGFPETHDLPLGLKRVYLFYPGEAHAPGNIVAWLPSEKLLWGGCMLKADGAGKGNLKDANLENWSLAVEKVKSRYPKARVLVPGHGDPGGPELLDYSILLMRPEK